MVQKKKTDPAARAGKPAVRAAKKGDKKVAAPRHGTAARQPSSHSRAKAPAAKVPTARAAAKPVAAPKPAEKKRVVLEKRTLAKPAATPPAKPVAAKPIAAKPVAAKPVAAKPVAAKPVAAKPIAARHAAGHVAAKPAAAMPPRTLPAAVAKPAGQKITAPVSTPPATPKDIAARAAAARPMMAAQKKSVSQRHGFKTNEFVVYPAHGVGRIVGIEEQEIAGMSLELFVITFEKEKLTLRVPTSKLQSVGMRKLADEDVVRKAMETLKGRARVKRTMWSRRAQEYVAKINSGDLVSIAEVVRDLYRSEAQPEQSYSERQLYEDALDRMAREIAAVEKLDERGAVQRIVEVLAKSARGRRIAEGAEVEAAA
jgi:CarD family transcriptional regulator